MNSLKQKAYILIKPIKKWYYAFKPGSSRPPEANHDPEVVFWDSVKDSRNPAVFRIYLERYPNGTFAKLAQIRLAEVEQPVSPLLSPLRKKWSTKLETFEKGGWSSFNKPTILGDRIYGGIMKRVFALDARTGNILWMRELSWYVHQNSSLDVTNGHVWVATGSEAYKLDMDTGAVVWKTNLPGNGVVNMTSYIDGKVVVLGNGGLYALDQGGQIAWHNRNMAGDGFATYKGVIYVGNKQEGQQTHMVGLDINTGKVLRKFATTHWARWEPTVHLGVLYFVDVGENLYALDIDNWTLRWKIKLEGRTYSPPIIKKGMLYIATDHTYAIDIFAGNIRWSQPYGEGTAAPFVGVDGLYVIGIEYTVDRDLSDHMRFQEPEYLTSKFNADDLAKLQLHLEKHGYRGKVLEDGYGILTFIYRLNINTGKVLWKERISPLTDSDCTPTEADGTIYVGTNDGVFHALDFN